MMPIDNTRLTSLSRYEDRAAGIAEGFLRDRFGPRSAFGILAEPLEVRTPPVWVICSSFGQEHGNLRRLEALLARRLARSGIASLRLRPDVDRLGGAMGLLELGPRLDEAEAAVTFLRASGRPVVGTVGVLTGGMVAALACESLALQAMVLVEPISRGRQYLREALRREAVAELMATVDEGADGGADGPLRELEQTGSTTVRGMRLERAEYERIQAVGLLDALRTFSGRALVVGISQKGVAGPGLGRLSEHLTAIGAESELAIVTDPLVAPFGEYYYENRGLLRVDTRLELDHRLAELVATFATRIEALSPVRQG